MPNKNLLNRIAVCSWSLRPENPADLIVKVQATGLSRIQLALNPLRVHPEIWQTIAADAASAGIEIVSGMLETKGEDYSTLESIRRTGGFVPDETWEENRANAPVIAQIAADLKLPLVTFHAGFLPESETDAKFPILIDRIREVADAFAAHGIDIGFETGQESAETLRFFLEKLDRPNVGVNFDPANLLAYNMGDPITSLKLLFPHLKQVHVKDGARPAPGKDKGGEVLPGTGEVDWKTFFATLTEGGYTGALVIEREKGDNRVEDVRTAIEVIKSSA